MEGGGRDAFRGTLKPPFNVEARTQAGLPETFYFTSGNGTIR